MVLAALAAAGWFGQAHPAQADDWGRVTVLEENDSLFFNSDKHYTQGLRLSALGLTQEKGGLWDDGFRLLGETTPFFAPGAAVTGREESVFLGQSIFTPKSLQVRPPDPHDRPYGGWLYVGSSLMQETNHHMLENAEIDLGVIGPGALGKQVQNDFHQFIGDKTAKGWSSQLQNEPGIVVSYERLWRERLLGSNAFGVDVVPQVGASGGNVYTYGEVGGLLRIGSGLDADYGPARIRPALSGTDYFDASGLDDGHAYYFFVGTQGRAVARDIFLDGNTFRTSPSVPKKSFVGDVEAGFSLLWSPHMRFDTSVVLRSEEFRGQRAPDDICTAALTFTW
jgi:lipid A 3-O-deacylase